jgi:hypothetical protein
LQSGKPAASGGVVELLVEGEPVAVWFVLVPRMLLLVLLPVLVLGVALSTCLVTLSQHSPEEGAALGEVVEVWAIDISYESVRSWVLKFGPAIARALRRCRPRPSDRWHLDEMVPGARPPASASAWSHLPPPPI